MSKRIRTVISFSLVGFLFSACGHLEGQSEDGLATIRNQLVDSAIVAAGIKNPRVIASMRRTPRHEFVPRRQRRYAYFDMSLPIGAGQTISPPYVVAFMTEQLDPQPGDRVLEVGTGSGYQAAVLSGLVDEVYTVEIVEALARRAARTLQSLGYENVHTKIGDGYSGWPEHAPFDKIIVTCSPEDIPQPLVRQLAEGGRIIVPLGERFQQTLYLFGKAGGHLHREALQTTFFVPMTGRAEQRRRVKPDTAHPSLAHGSFEQTVESSSDPAGWYYVRQGRVTADRNAPDGGNCLAFSNSVPGRDAHALQSFGVDGRSVRSLEVSLWVRGKGVQPGRGAREQTGVLVAFYGEDRAPVGSEALGPWSGTFGWTHRQARIKVPTNARLAVIAIGLLGGTGDVAFDLVEVSRAN